MTRETDRQSQPKNKQDPSLTDHLDATDFFPPGTGWNTDAAGPADAHRQDARGTPQSPQDQPGH